MLQRLFRGKRGAGKLLAEIERSEGGRPPNNSSHDAMSLYAQILKDSDLGHTTANHWQLEARVPEERFEQFIAETKAKGQELTSVGLRALAQIEIRREEIDRLRRMPPPPPPIGKYNVIVIDPPWPYGGDYDPSTIWGQLASPYPEMDLDELEELKKLIIPAAHDDCILWLWTTNTFMHEAYHLLETWGFAPKTILTWFKQQQIGVGYWLRGQTEHCLLAVKGKPAITHEAQGTALFAKPRGHSVKPDEFYQLVDSLCPGRKLDMFARRGREGWDTWGKEAPG